MCVWGDRMSILLSLSRWLTVQIVKLSVCWRSSEMTEFCQGCLSLLHPINHGWLVQKWNSTCTHMHTHIQIGLILSLPLFLTLPLSYYNGAFCGLDQIASQKSKSTFHTLASLLTFLSSGLIFVLFYESHENPHLKLCI